MNNQIFYQASHFKYLSCNSSYVTDIDWDSTEIQFRRICGTIHKYLKNKTRKYTRMKFYKSVAVPTFLCASKTWNLGKKDVEKIQATKTKFLRGKQGRSLLDRRRNDDIRRDLNAVYNCTRTLNNTEGDGVNT